MSLFFFSGYTDHLDLHSFPTRRSSDLHLAKDGNGYVHPRQVRSISIREAARLQSFRDDYAFCGAASDQWTQLGNARSEEHTSELQSQSNLVCRLLLEKKKIT